MIPVNARKKDVDALAVERMPVEPVPPVSLHGYDHKSFSADVALALDTDSLVQQQFGVESDINTIVKRFGVTGQMPFGRSEGIYGDFTEILDFESLNARVARARESFMKLPPEVREKFGNDPLNMWRRANALSEEAFLAEVQAATPEKPAGDAPADS